MPAVEVDKSSEQEERNGEGKVKPCPEPSIITSIGWDGSKNPSTVLWLGGACMQLFVLGVWILSCASPGICVLCLHRGGKVCTVIVALIVLATAWPYIANPRPWPALRRAISGLGQCYHHEARLHLETPMLKGGGDGKSGGGVIRSDVPTIACFHPHGIFCQGYILNGGFRKEMDPPLPGLLSELLYYAPLFRWFIGSWTGACVPANKGSMLRLMRRGDSFGLIPGGFEEAAIFERGVDRVFIKSRKGFVKYALQYGYRLMPCYTFGEVDTYSNVPGLLDLKVRLAAKRLPAVLPFGAWWCPMLPKPSRLNTVWGTPVVLPRIAEPTAAEIDKFHAAYVAALVALFDRHKARFAGNPTATLDVW